VSISTVRTDTHRDLDDPIRCEVSAVERISSRSTPHHIKVCGAYVNSFFARRTAERNGADDGLMFDREGNLTEAAAANVFLIRGDRLITPRLEPDVFPGSPGPSSRRSRMTTGSMPRKPRCGVRI
jgi:branched-chain amino acid aminotransferase